MARTPVEIGQAFHKAESPLVVWTVNSFNEFTEPMHARLIRLDDELLSKVDGAVKSRFLMRVGWVIIVHVYFTRPTDRRIV